MKTSKLSARDLCMIGVCTAVMAIMAQISVPMPFGVPMTMQTFAIMLTSLILGAKKGAIASLIYILLGAAGVPVFANFSGGYQILAGPTGGFILTFPVMSYVIGLGMDKRDEIKGAFTGGIIIGTVINYIGGVLFFCLVTGSDAWVGFTACVFPFLPTAVIKAVLAAVIGLKIRGRLIKAACSI